MEWILALVMTPYIAISAYDAFLHPRRRVSMAEGALHGVSALSVLTFLVTSFFGYFIPAAIALAIAIPVIAADELIFHRDLGGHESLVHAGAHVSFIFYIGFWVWMQ